MTTSLGHQHRLGTHGDDNIVWALPGTTTLSGHGGDDNIV
jgi:hypothetical protein